MRLFGDTPRVNLGSASKGRHALASVQCTHAYLQVMKLGALRSWSNYRKGVEFVCQARWVAQ
eukprot:2643719-Alexandrium_andersonii.AAC.1